jgi:signal transduction histidine kinase
LSTTHRRADELATRWIAQVKSVALMDDAQLHDSAHADWARGFIETLLASPGVDENDADDGITTGLTFGASAFLHGASLHHTMKALDLLSAIVLYAVETSVEQVPPDTAAGAAQGIRLARHLQRRVTLLSLATTRGYMQAYTEALRERFRHLRHDLRNPLGTIKSVLSLMDDESVPLDARADPRFQAIAKRNARSLEDLIADRLSDAAALLPMNARQQVSLRSVACSVRRDLRAEIERRGVTVLVGSTAPYGHVDAPALELVLRGVLQAVLHECSEGDQLHLEFSGPVDGHVTVNISCESGREPMQNGAALEHLSLLSHRIGATISTGRSILLTVPMQSLPGEAVGSIAMDSERDKALPRAPATLGDRNARDDVGSLRQRHHGQSGAL